MCLAIRFHPEIDGSTLKRYSGNIDQYQLTECTDIVVDKIGETLCVVGGFDQLQTES